MNARHGPALRAWCWLNALLNSDDAARAGLTAGERRQQAMPLARRLADALLAELARD
jgi:hypothetical protein